MNFEYSLLNLLHNVREGGTIIAGYEYGYEGDKLKVSGRGSNGYAYVESLVYWLRGSFFVFESGLFGEGVVSGIGKRAERLLSVCMRQECGNQVS